VGGGFRKGQLPFLAVRIEPPHSPTAYTRPCNFTPSPSSHAHTCTHMHTHAHTCTHMYTHAHMHTHVHTCIHMHTHAHNAVQEPVPEPEPAVGCGPRLCVRIASQAVFSLIFPSCGPPAHHHPVHHHPVHHHHHHPGLTLLAPYPTPWRCLVASGNAPPPCSDPLSRCYSRSHPTVSLRRWLHPACGPCVVSLFSPSPPLSLRLASLCGAAPVACPFL
jgi:hypothetical protein